MSGSFNNSLSACARSRLATQWIRRLSSVHLRRNKSCEAWTIRCRKQSPLGAKLLTGGNRIHGPGFFYEPTVLVDVPKESPAYREEIFGPVAAVFRVGDADAAVELANDTRFGLGSSAWTKDRKEQKLFASELDSRNGFHQRDGRVRSASAIRRRKTFRFWPRTRRRGHSRIHEHENDLDFLNARRASNRSRRNKSYFQAATVERSFVKRKPFRS